MFINLKGLTINLSKVLYFRCAESQFAWEDGYIYAAFVDADETVVYKGDDAGEVYNYLLSTLKDSVGIYGGSDGEE